MGSPAPRRHCRAEADKFSLAVGTRWCEGLETRAREPLADCARSESVLAQVCSSASGPPCPERRPGLADETGKPGLNTAGPEYGALLNVASS